MPCPAMLRTSETEDPKILTKTFMFKENSLKKILEMKNVNPNFPGAYDDGVYHLHN